MGLRDWIFGDPDLVLEVHGMACKRCRSAVESVVKRLDAVRSVRVALEDRQAQIHLDRDIEPENLIDAIRDAGYEARLAAGDRG